MKLLSWNLNGRRLVAREQVAAVARRRPDVVAFQEVTEGTLGILRRALIERGLPFAVNSFELQESRSQLTGPRRYGAPAARRAPVAGTRVTRSRTSTGRAMTPDRFIFSLGSTRDNQTRGRLLGLNVLAVEITLFSKEPGVVQNLTTADQSAMAGQRCSLGASPARRLPIAQHYN